MKDYDYHQHHHIKNLWCSSIKNVIYIYLTIINFINTIVILIMIMISVMVIIIIIIKIIIVIIIMIIIDDIVILSWNTWGQQRSAMHFSFLDLGRLLFPGNCWSGIWRNSSCHIPSISRPYGIMKLKVRAIVLVVAAVFFFKYSSSQISRLFTRVQFQKQNFDAQPGTWPRSCWQYPLVLDGFDQQISLAVFF